MSLELDVVYKNKGSKSMSFLDKRKFRGQQNEKDKNILEFKDILDKFGITENKGIIKEMMKIDKIYQLNKQLIIIVYLYMENRNFDLFEITKDFDTDFSEQLDKISEYGLFKQIAVKDLEYKFRQDFICYIFIIDDYLRKELSIEEGFDLDDDIDDMDIELSMERSLEDYQDLEENDL
jgi:hypothetical protein